MCIITPNTREDDLAFRLLERYKSVLGKVFVKGEYLSKMQTFHSCKADGINEGEFFVCVLPDDFKRFSLFYLSYPINSCSALIDLLDDLQRCSVAYSF